MICASEQSVIVDREIHEEFEKLIDYEEMIYKAVKKPLSAFFKVVYKPEIIGSERIPESGRIILAGNHTNYFDCILVACATDRCVHYLAKDELMKGPLKIIFKNLGIIPVNRRTKDKAALETAISYLNDDKLIGIFPEGTINRTNDIIMPFKFGAVKMASETKTPVIPFVITGKSLTRYFITLIALSQLIFSSYCAYTLPKMLYGG